MANGERGQGQRKGGGIGLGDQIADRFVEAQGAAEIAVENAVPIVDVLGAERNVEAVGVARRLDIGTGGAFAEHGLDGVSGDEVDEQKDHADDQPDDRQHVGEASEEIANHAWDFPLGLEALGSAAGASGMRSTLTAPTRWPSISSTVKRRCW